MFARRSGGRFDSVLWHSSHARLVCIWYASGLHSYALVCAESGMGTFLR
jgi:hypothetical protein